RLSQRVCRASITEEAQAPVRGLVPRCLTGSVDNGSNRSGMPPPSTRHAYPFPRSLAAGFFQRAVGMAGVGPCLSTYDMARLPTPAGVCTLAVSRPIVVRQAHHEG